MKFTRLLLAALALCAAQARAQQTDPAPPTPEQAQQRAEQFMASLKPQHGTIKLPDNVATLQLNDSERLLTQGWGNPPGDKTLGMIIPQAVSPMSRNGWGVVITYSDDGHVSDSDANKIDYNDLMNKMKKDDEEENEQRKKQGYAGLHILGWAEPPSYDGATHKMYWAKELKADDADENTLNYAIRVLGRRSSRKCPRCWPSPTSPTATSTPTSTPAPTRSPPTAWPRWWPAASPPRPACSPSSASCCWR
jgi:uncharacterized membrane-anchored protein